MENIWRSSSFITHPFSVHPSYPRGTENPDYSTNSENETMKRSEADRKFQNDEANSEAITRFNFWSRREGRQRGIEPSDGVERRGKESKKKKVGARRKDCSFGVSVRFFSLLRAELCTKRALEMQIFGWNARRYVGETEVRTLRPQVNSTEIDNPRTWATYSVCEIMADRSRYGQPIRCVAIHPAYDNPTMSSSTEVRFDVRCEYMYIFFYPFYFDLLR